MSVAELQLAQYTHPVGDPAVTAWLYPTNEKVAPNTLAFNLQSELDRAREHGPAYEATFIDNSHFYGLETYVKGRAQLFDYSVQQSDQGKRLFFPKSNIDALDSFAKPITDTSRPAWLRERDYRDRLIIEGITQELDTAPIGTTWAAVSPAIPDTVVSEAQRKVYGYGHHSFLFLHQLQKDEKTGGQKLVCRAIRNYLPLEQQKEYLKELTGQDIPLNQVHGAVGQLISDNPQFNIFNNKDISRIQATGSQIGDRVGVAFLGGETPEALDAAEQRERDIIAQMKTIDWWLTDVYQDLLLLPPSPTLQQLQSIQSKFRGWEGAVQAIAEGKGLDTRLMNHRVRRNGLGAGELLTTIDARDPRLQLIQLSMSMRGGMGTCGMGSGFGIVGESSGIFGEMVSGFGLHAGATFMGETAARYESYKCPHSGCGKLIPGELKGQPDKWRTECPHCHNPIGCKPK
jgi:hypothetical protein